MYYILIFALYNYNMENSEQILDNKQKDDIRNRIIELIEKLGLDRTTFANSINVKQATLSHILTGRNDPTLNIILQIHNKYPDVDINWLLYGKGNDPSVTGQQEQNSCLAENAEQTEVKERIVYIDRPQKKIAEIRVFYDDQTFDIFTRK